MFCFARVQLRTRPSFVWTAAMRTQQGRLHSVHSEAVLQQQLRRDSEEATTSNPPKITFEGMAAGATVVGTLVGAYTLYDHIMHRDGCQVVVESILNNRLSATPDKPYIHRGAYEAVLERLLEKEDGHSVLVSGNHAVGKSALMEKVLGEQGAVTHVLLTDPKVSPQAALIDQLNATNLGQVVAALRAVKHELNKLPIIVLDVTRAVDNPDIMKAVSGLAKALGFDLRAARMVVLASSAAAALIFDPDGRVHEVFVQPLSKLEMENAEVDAFLNTYGGERAVKHKDGIYDLTGGNIGRMKAIAEQLKESSWDAVQAHKLHEQESEVINFLGIDLQGGFGHKEIKAASELACMVANVPYDQCVPQRTLQLKGVAAKHFAFAVRSIGAHPIYFNVSKDSYCCASPTHHMLLKKMCKDTKSQC